MAYDPLASFRREPRPVSAVPLSEQEALQNLSEIRPQVVRLLQTFKEFINDSERDYGVNYWAVKADIDHVLSKISPEKEQVLEESQDKEPEQGLKSEPVYTRMTDAEIEKAARAIQLLEEAAQTHTEQDIEPEM